MTLEGLLEEVRKVDVKLNIGLGGSQSVEVRIGPRQSVRSIVTQAFAKLRRAVNPEVEHSVVYAGHKLTGDKILWHLIRDNRGGTDRYEATVLSHPRGMPAEFVEPNAVPMAGRV